MRPAAFAFTAVGFLVSTAAAVWVADYAVDHIENTSNRITRNALVAAGQSWVSVEANGTWVQLSGTAPDERDHIQALSVVSAVVSPSRIKDLTDVAQSVPIVAPDFAMEILRSGADISLIGITPADGDTDIIRDTIASMNVELIDMKETTNWDAPEGWVEALTFGSSILSKLDRAKISIAPGKVGLIAVVESQERRDEIIVDLNREKPAGVDLTIDITAPRPIFSPYVMIFVGGPTPTLRCNALTDAGGAKILAAAKSGGLANTTRCTIGLGAPTDDWADIAVLGIKAITEMGGGQVEIRDSNIALTAPLDFDAEQFSTIETRLRAALPAAYILIPELPVTEAVISTDRPWFTATQPADGLVVLNGMVIDPISQQTISTFAESRFGFEQIDDKTKVAEFAPHGWTSRQLVAVDVLSLLDEGRVSFTEDTVTVTGKGSADEIADVVQQKLEAGFGAGARFSINVEQLERVKLVEDLPDAKKCEADIAQLLSEQQISFAPSSAVISAESVMIIGKIAAILNECRHAAFEVGGHTDSQGREEMNLNLSQNRANSVVDALLSRNLLLGNLTAVGYGETQPIGDNDTEEGRQLNRRIEFVLNVAEPVVALAGEAPPTEAVTIDGEVEQRDAPFLRPDDFNKGVNDGTD